MACDLSDEDLKILDILYSKRCVSSAHEMNSKLLEKLFRYRCKNGDFDKCIRHLLNKGYVATVPKKDPKYYLNPKKAIIALNLHGYDTTRGKPRR